MSTDYKQTEFLVTTNTDHKINMYTPATTATVTQKQNLMTSEGNYYRYLAKE